MLAANKWPFRLHATYDESISRMLDVFEKANRDIPFDGLHWMFDHAETITERNIEQLPWLSIANAPTCFGMSDKVQGYIWHTHNQLMFNELSLSQ